MFEMWEIIELGKALTIMGAVLGGMYYFAVGSPSAKRWMARKLLAQFMATEEDKDFCRHASRATPGWGQTDSDHDLCLIERLDERIGDDPELIKAYRDDIKMIMEKSK